MSEAGHAQWFQEKYPHTYRDAMDGDDAARMYMAHSKSAWLASRESVIVELPNIGDYIDRYGQGENCDSYVTDLIDAIHGAGVKIK